MTNKPLYLRKLKDGKWIVLALDSEALVIDEDLAESFLQGTSTPSGQQQEFTLMENFAILH